MSSHSDIRKAKSCRHAILGEISFQTIALMIVQISYTRRSEYLNLKLVPINMYTTIRSSTKIWALVSNSPVYFNLIGLTVVDVVPYSCENSLQKDGHPRLACGIHIAWPPPTHFYIFAFVLV